MRFLSRGGFTPCILTPQLKTRGIIQEEGRKKVVINLSSQRHTIATLESELLSSSNPFTTFEQQRGFVVPLFEELSICTQRPPSFIIMKADESAATLYNCGRITDMYGKAYQYLPHILLPPPLYPDNDVYIITPTSTSRHKCFIIN